MRLEKSVVTTGMFTRDEVARIHDLVQKNRDTFDGLRIHDASLYMEAFGVCSRKGTNPEAHRARVSDETEGRAAPASAPDMFACSDEQPCKICIVSRQNWTTAFHQPCRNKLIVPPFLYRDIFQLSVGPVGYFTVLTAYTAVITHLTGLFRPDNTTLYPDDAWIRAAKPYRELAWPLWQAGEDAFERAIADAFGVTKTHLDVLLAFESRVCYGQAIMDVVNDDAGESVWEADKDALLAAVSRVYDALVSRTCSLRVVEWTDVARADGVERLAKHVELLNKEHEMLQSHLYATADKGTEDAAAVEKGAEDVAAEKGAEEVAFVAEDVTEECGADPVSTGATDTPTPALEGDGTGSDPHEGSVRTTEESERDEVATDVGVEGNGALVSG